MAAVNEAALPEPPGQSPAAFWQCASAAGPVGVAAACWSPEGRGKVSGHTRVQRFRFACSLLGPFVALGIIIPGKDLYMLEFGADPGAIGQILFAYFFAITAMDVTAGNLADKNAVLGRCFPASLWGKRAPWFLTHNAWLAPLVICFFFPPAKSPIVLHLWFALLLFAGYWCVTVSLNAFESARVEIYPFKEERIDLEQYNKLTYSFAFGLASGAMAMCLDWREAWVYAVGSSLCALVALSGLVATNVLRDAAGKPQVATRKRFRDQFALAMRSPLVLRMLAIRFVQGLYETILPSLLIYYYTNVFELEKQERFLWYAAGGLMMGAVELSLAPVWARMFSRSTELMLYVPLTMRVVDAVLAPIMLIAFQNLYVFILYVVIWRMCNSGYSYWRIAAAAWVCDLDEGENQGLLMGMFTSANNLGRALTYASTVLGLSLANLRTTNCWNLDEEAEAQCEYDKVYGQPASLKYYLVLMFGVVAPVLELVVCGLTAEFPIKPGSKLLQELCRKQVEDKLGGCSRSTSPEEQRSPPGASPAPLWVPEPGEPAPGVPVTDPLANELPGKSSGRSAALAARPAEEVVSLGSRPGGPQTLRPAERGAPSTPQAPGPGRLPESDPDARDPRAMDPTKE